MQIFPLGVSFVVDYLFKVFLSETGFCEIEFHANGGVRSKG